MYKKCSKSLFYIELSVKILKSFIKCATQTLSYQRLQEYLWWIKHVFYCVSGSSSSRSSTQTYRLRLAPLYPIFQSLFFATQYLSSFYFLLILYYVCKRVLSIFSSNSISLALLNQSFPRPLFNLNIDSSIQRH